MTCEAGYTLNDTLCTCSLSDICQLSPCQNEGSCTLVSAPSDYTCDCTGTGYQGINCSVSLLYIVLPRIFIPVPLLPDIDIPLSSTQIIILEGNDLTVNCTVPGNISYTIWTYEDGSIVVDNSSTLQQLYITNMTQSNSGRYSCIAGLENGKMIEYAVDVIVEGKCTVQVN